jgi:hypothetical protein
VVNNMEALKGVCGCPIIVMLKHGDVFYHVHSIPISVSNVVCMVRVEEVRKN